MSAGGTAGHMFPAVSTAMQMQTRGWRVVFISDKRGKAWNKDSNMQRSYSVACMPVSGRKNIQFLISIFVLAIGVMQALCLLIYLKPKMVVGFGGYASVPALVAARLLKIKTALHEQNAILGRANRLFADGIDAIGMSFSKVEALDQSYEKKAWWVGNPIREDIASNASAPYRFDVSQDDPIRILIIGGSQGAELFGNIIPHALLNLPEDLRQRLRVTQQLRDGQLEEVRELYIKAGIEADLSPFFDNLGKIMKQCHLIIGRAGASTIAEIAVIGRPCVLIPYKYAVDDHQMANASNLADAACGWVLPEHAFDVETLTKRLTTLFSEPKLLYTAARASEAIAKPNAANDMANLLEALHNDRLDDLSLEKVSAVTMHRQAKDEFEIV